MYDKEPSKSNLAVALTDYCVPKGYSSDSQELFLIELGDIFNTHISSETFVTNQMVEFIRRQKFKDAIIQGIDILDKNKGNESFEEVLKMINNAISVGVGFDKGLGYEDLKTLLPEYKKVYNKETLLRTGFSTYDSALEGGMAAGELHIILGPPGRGKTTFGVNVGCHGLIQNKLIIHISLELSEYQILAKYACRLSGFTYTELMTVSDTEYQESIKKFDVFKPNLRVKHYPPKTVNTLTLRAYITKLRSEFGNPGLIIIDYDDYLIPVAGLKGNMYEDSGGIYTDMVQLAEYFSCPILSFSQPTRDSWDKIDNNSVIVMENIAHSAMKVHIAYSISSLNVSRADKTKGILYMDKVRRGRDNVTIPLKLDLAKALILEDKFEETVDD